MTAVGVRVGAQRSPLLPCHVPGLRHPGCPRFPDAPPNRRGSGREMPVAQRSARNGRYGTASARPGIHTQQTATGTPTACAHAPAWVQARMNRARRRAEDDEQERTWRLLLLDEISGLALLDRGAARYRVGPIGAVTRARRASLLATAFRA